MGPRLDALAALYWLADPSRFVPLRPAAAERAFFRLGALVGLQRRKTWDDYERYLNLVEELRQGLEPWMPGATLLDAFVFLSFIAERDDVAEAIEADAPWRVGTPAEEEAPGGLGRLLTCLVRGPA